MKLNRTPRDPHRELKAHAEQVNALSEGRLEATYNAYTTYPTTGQHAKGDFVKNSAPAALGTAGNEYLIYGWICTVGGTPGTWVECRFMNDNVGAAGSTSPGGSDTQIQFNDSGAFGGDADFTWDKTNNVLTLGNETTSATIQTPAAVSANTDGPNVLIYPGAGTGTAYGGSFYAYGAEGGATGAGGNATISGGPGGATSGAGGEANVNGGSSANGAGGAASVSGGVATGGVGGVATVIGGWSYTHAGGRADLFGGPAVGGNGNGGDGRVSGGSGYGTGNGGNVILIPGAPDPVGSGKYGFVALMGLGTEQATTADAGWPCLASTNGPPTVAPVGVPTGTLAFCYDRANNKMYVYNGAWKASAAFT